MDVEPFNSGLNWDVVKSIHSQFNLLYAIKSIIINILKLGSKLKNPRVDMNYWPLNNLAALK